MLLARIAEGLLSNIVDAPDVWVLLFGGYMRRVMKSRWGMVLRGFVCRHVNMVDDGDGGAV